METSLNCEVCMHATSRQVPARPRDLVRPFSKSAPGQLRVSLASARVAATRAVATPGIGVNQKVREGETETALVQLQVGVRHGMPVSYIYAVMHAFMHNSRQCAAAALRVMIVL